MFVTVNVYVTVSPASAVPSPPSSNVPVLIRSINGSCSKVWVSLSVSVTGSSFGSVPVAVAMLVNVPASMSPCVRVYDAVNVVESMAPGAIVAIGAPTTVTNGSVTVTFVNVTLPVFVTVNVYVTVSPASATPSPPSSNVPVLIRSINGSCAKVCVSSSVSSTGGPTSGLPVTVAVLVNVPVSISDC